MKYHLITLFLSIAIAILIVISMLMINIPQLEEDVLLTLESYNNIIKEDFKFDNYKNITDDVAEKQYVVTQNQINNFEKTNALNTGNANPFTPASDLEDETENGDDDKTNDKTDSSNGGTTNDSNTGK